MKKLYFLWFSAIYGLSIAAFCHSDEQSSLILSPEALNHLMNSSKNITILDVRKEKVYLQGHIKDAINLNVNKTFNREGRTDKVASFSYLQKLFGDAGLDMKQLIVLYDDGVYINAARMFWTLEVMGHKHVKVLQGGFPLWKKNNLPVSVTRLQLKPTPFLANIAPEKLATKLTIRLAIANDDPAIIDARTTEEFLGKKSITTKKGHIPTAISIPWDHNLYKNKEGLTLIRPPTELRKLYQNFNSKTAIITYCNKGKQSSFSYLILRELGYETSHYDGSWYEWSNDNNLPIATHQKKI